MNALTLALMREGSVATSTWIVAAGFFLYSVSVAPGMTASSVLVALDTATLFTSTEAVGIGERHTGATGQGVRNREAVGLPRVLRGQDQLEFRIARLNHGGCHGNIGCGIDRGGELRERRRAADGDRNAADRQRACVGDGRGVRVWCFALRRRDLRVRQILDDDFVMAGDRGQPRRYADSCRVAGRPVERVQLVGGRKIRRGLLQRGDLGAERLELGNLPLDLELAVLQSLERLAGLLHQRVEDHAEVDAVESAQRDGRTHSDSFIAGYARSLP
jgi:hypothetical protein